MECKLRDLTLAYEAVGTGRPLIVLHGRGADHRSVMHTLEPLFEKRSGWRRIYPDLPGTGGTRAPEGMAAHDQVLDVITEFIDAVMPGERFVLAGVSYGAYLARGVVHRRSRRLNGVLLIVPSIERDAARQSFPEPQILKEDAAFLAALRPDEQWLRDAVVMQSRALLDEVRDVLIPALAAADQDFVQRLDSVPGFAFDVDALDEPVSAPALIVAGRQDSVCGYREAWSILDNYPRGTFAVLDCAGHMLTREQKTLFDALASEWLDRVEAYVLCNDG
ncbi:MAG: alpha/beta hydrolase [Anaerolineae bacterium]|nr:alpha/beta hydrolase [Anaerolineae bacterium]